MNLLQLVKETNELEQRLIESGGELTPELESKLLVTAQELPKKVDSYNHIFNQLEARAEAFKKQADEYYTAAKTLENTVERIKGYIKSVCRDSGQSVLIGENVKFTITDSAPKLVIENASELPDSYKMQVVKIEPDKELIKNDLLTMAVSEIPGAKLVPGKTLRIYPFKG